jgi:hypothetical protein
MDGSTRLCALRVVKSDERREAKCGNEAPGLGGAGLGMRVVPPAASGRLFLASDLMRFSSIQVPVAHPSNRALHSTPSPIRAAVRRPYSAVGCQRVFGFVPTMPRRTKRTTVVASVRRSDYQLHQSRKPANKMDARRVLSTCPVPSQITEETPQHCTDGCHLSSSVRNTVDCFLPPAVVSSAATLGDVAAVIVKPHPASDSLVNRDVGRRISAPRAMSEDERLPEWRKGLI